jgi:hypothetical protein
MLVAGVDLLLERILVNRRENYCFLVARSLENQINTDCAYNSLIDMRYLFTNFNPVSFLVHSFIHQLRTERRHSDEMRLRLDYLQ